MRIFYFSFSISILLVTHTYVVYGTRVLCELRIWTWRLYRFSMHIQTRSYSIRVSARGDPGESYWPCHARERISSTPSRVGKARVSRSVKFVSRSRDRDRFLASSSASPVRSHENTRFLLPRVEHIGILTYTNKCIVIQDSIRRLCRPFTIQEPYHLPRRSETLTIPISQRKTAPAVIIASELGFPWGLVARGLLTIC